MKKKRKLKKWVKVTLKIILIIIIGLILGQIIKKGFNNYEKLASQCDREHGYTCSYYDIRQFSLGK